MKTKTKEKSFAKDFLPKYVQKCISERRLVPCKYMLAGDFLGYTFRFSQRWKTTEDGRFHKDLQRFLTFAIRKNADAKVLKYERKVRNGSIIWSAIVGVTDPVALFVEKAQKENCSL